MTTAATFWPFSWSGRAVGDLHDETKLVVAQADSKSPASDSDLVIRDIGLLHG
jgi:hypothetical protein